MQLFSCQLYQDSSEREKRGFCLLQFRKHFAFAFKRPFTPLPSKGLCLQSALAFVMEGPLRTKGLHFNVPFPSPSKGIHLCHQRALFAFKVHLLLPSKSLCDRRALPLKGLCLQSALPYIIEWALPSKGLSLHSARVPLPSKGLICFQIALPFAFEGPFP